MGDGSLNGMVSACVPTMRFLWEKKELYSQATRAAGVANGSTYSSFLIKSNHLKVAGIMGELAKPPARVLTISDFHGGISAKRTARPEDPFCCIRG